MRHGHVHLHQLGIAVAKFQVAVARIFPLRPPQLGVSRRHSSGSRRLDGAFDEGEKLFHRQAALVLGHIFGFADPIAVASSTAPPRSALAGCGGTSDSRAAGNVGGYLTYSDDGVLSTLATPTDKNCLPT